VSRRRHFLSLYLSTHIHHELCISRLLVLGTAYMYTCMVRVIYSVYQQILPAVRIRQYSGEKYSMLKSALTRDREYAASQGERKKQRAKERGEKVWVGVVLRRSGVMFILQKENSPSRRAFVFLARCSGATAEGSCATERKPCRGKITRHQTPARYRGRLPPATRGSC